MAGPFSSDFMFLKKEHIRLSVSVLVLARRHLRRKAICRLQALIAHSKVSSRGSPVLNNCCTTVPADCSREASAANRIYLLLSPARCTNDSSRIAKVGVKMTMASANRNRRFLLLRISPQIEFASKLNQLPSSSVAFSFPILFLSPFNGISEHWQSGKLKCN